MSVRPPRPSPPEGVTSLPIDAVALALSPDGKWLAAGNLAGRVMLWDLSRGVYTWSELLPEGNRVRPVALSSKGFLIAGSFDMPDVPWRVYRTDTPALVKAFGGPKSVAVAAAFAPGGATFVTASEAPGELAVASSGASIDVLWKKSVAATAVALDDHNVAWLAAEGDKTVLHVVRLADDVELLKTEDTLAYDRVALEPDAAVVARGTTIVRNALPPLAALTKVKLADERYPIRELVPRFAVTRPANEGIVVWSSLDGSQLGELATACACELHALSADGCIAACACAGEPDVRWGKVARRDASACP